MPTWTPRCGLELLLLQVSLSLSLRLKGLFLYTVGILRKVEWCIRQLWCSILSYSRISLAA